MWVRKVTVPDGFALMVTMRGNFMIVGRIYLHHALSQDKSHIGHRMKIHHLCHQYYIIGRQSQRFLMRL